MRQIFEKTILAFLLVMAAGGCTSSRFVNLTPSDVPRDDSNLYPFEVAFETNQRSLEKETIQAYVVVNEDFYPMKPTKIVKDRWETLVPVDALTDQVHYRYKFDYLYKSIPQRAKGSILSPPYQLMILDQ